MGTQTAHEIRWLTWGPEAFEKAASEGKLILLDSGATWCHWCHVMDRTTYEDPELAALVDRNFIPVRIDRDRLPEVDAHFQRAQALTDSGGAGGWPLTVVLTPEGHILFKATFLPPRADPRFGVGTGLIEVLRRLDEYWRAHRPELLDAGRQASRQLRDPLGELFSQAGQVGKEALGHIVSGIKAAYDPLYGGFGQAPKFFAAPAIELLLARAWSGDGEARQIVLHTLESISRGGVYDQVGGGFHRYSTDRQWHVPHFEKMAYDNAAMLANYADAYALTGHDDFARVARQTLAWIAMVLQDPLTGAFYASQDADVGGDDDGDYFTWTSEEVRAVLGKDADAVISYYGIDSVGDMAERPGRSVLHVPKTIIQLAGLLRTDAVELLRTIASGRVKLFQARRTRTRPGVDRTVFADLNGMMIDAHLNAYERLSDERARRAAIQALDHVLATLRQPSGAMAHYRDGADTPQTPLLSDQAWIGKALVHAYAVTAEPRYLDAATKLADFMLEHLTAPDGGFLSATAAGEGPTVIEPRRSWDDSPARSAASVAAQMLIELAHLSGEDKYRAAAGRALASMAGAIDASMGIFLAGWALAAEEFLNGPRCIVVVGAFENCPCCTGLVRTRDSAASEIGEGEERTVNLSLALAARRAYVPAGLVMVLDPAKPDEADLLHRLGFADKKHIAYVCTGKQCLEFAWTVEELQQRLSELSKA